MMVKSQKVIESSQFYFLQQVKPTQKYETM